MHYLGQKQVVFGALGKLFILIEMRGFSGAIQAGISA
jgi:hypothetical protein